MYTSSIGPASYTPTQLPTWSLQPVCSHCQPLPACAAPQAKHAVFSSPLVATAYAVAARAHAGQFRKNGDPVLSHAAATAEVLAQLGLPDTIVAAGLLHDVLCDTPMTACQLEEYLPREVVALVEKVGRISSISQVYRDNTHTLEAEALLDMLTSMADVSALLIKLADRLDSMRSLGALPRCKQVGRVFRGFLRC